MKNIHILPTDKPSRLHLKSDGYYLSKDISSYIPYSYPQHIYITSNEEIKEEDYVCASGGFRFVKTLNNDKARTFEDDGIVSKQNSSSSCHLSNYKKIILTTDQDLIKDGVQAIDDEFLEWFVKNPSCEEIETKVEFIQTPDNLKDGFYYKIIIPKEEQKQHLIDIMRGDEELGLYEEPKQETLDEIEIISKQRIHKYRPMNPHPMSFFIGFNDGIEWQKERMYSDEEVVSILYEQLESLDYYGEDFSFSLFWEKFKKK